MPPTPGRKYALKHINKKKYKTIFKDLMVGKTKDEERWMFCIC